MLNSGGDGDAPAGLPDRATAALRDCRAQIDWITQDADRAATEGSAQALIVRLDPRLRFSRDYATGIRPYADYCEEKIELLV